MFIIKAAISPDPPTKVSAEIRLALWFNESLVAPSSAICRGNATPSPRHRRGNATVNSLLDNAYCANPSGPRAELAKRNAMTLTNVTTTVAIRTEL
jgi:hypothetical protein